ncbi:MAG: bifunctional folylpolyglutamate synthase/dihydrofolate synthase [Magnetococcales bacterium]|nr:bifunctional folylpolyglutamate synthase/dihydrofolate synthase [Magnetococcales bacterium]
MIHPLSLETLLRQSQEHETGGVVLGLSRVEQLLDALGNPQQGLQFIHVAGTNGKGSVVAFLAAILRKANIKVGVYTSPHLIKFNERITVDQKQIADKDLRDNLQKVLDVCRNENIPASFFEITTATALLYFANMGLAKNGDKSSIVILETGLGGRLDATNVVDPLLCLITSIAHDHENFLGSNLNQIAKEKAGIIKPGVHVVAAPGSLEAEKAISDKAAQVAANLELMGRNFNFKITQPTSNSWQFQDQKGQLSLPKPGLEGEHQYINCALAVAGIRILADMGWHIPSRAISDGVNEVSWPGRLQWYKEKNPAILLDGAHNLDAARTLKQYLNSIYDKTHAFILIFAALKNKNVTGIINTLSPMIHSVFTVGVGGERGIDSAELAKLWQDSGVLATPCNSAKEALAMARSQSHPQQIILVAGSLYLVGEIQTLVQ